MRDLRERVNYLPAESPFKVYIVDEVHMMTTPAFNALLKILEEPPRHVIFILATTEAHRLPSPSYPDASASTSGVSAKAPSRAGSRNSARTRA